MKNQNKASAKTPFFDRFLNGLEKVCGKLPPPPLLFAGLFLFVALLSLILGLAGAGAVNPATGEEVRVQNFFSNQGLTWFVSHMITNFSTFAPLGLVLTMTIAIGLCEESGLITALLKDRLKNISPVLLPFVIAFVGTVGNLASDTALVVIPPIAAVLYLGAGKHPIAGLICGYAATNGGFAANLMISGTDGLLQGISQGVLNNMPQAGVRVEITDNWFFMIASTFLCTLTVGLACHFLVDKRFGAYRPENGLLPEKPEPITPREKIALKKAGLALLLYILAVAALTLWGPLGLIQGDESRRGFVGSYLLNYLVPVLFFFFIIPGITYGFAAGVFVRPRDIVPAMVRQLSAMGSFIAFCFFCSQFQALFVWTNIDKLMAIGGAGLIDNISLHGFLLAAVFILFVGLINLMMSSGSAKWGILAPIFIPMLMMTDRFHPAFIQLIYRLGDSPTNAFAPLSPYLWMILAVAQSKYDKKATIGTLAKGLFPVAMVLQFAWIAFLGLWMLLNLPIGPGAGIYLPG